MSPERTVREVVDLIVELGLVEPETPAQRTFLGRQLLVESFDEPLSYYGHTEQSAVLASSTSSESGTPSTTRRSVTSVRAAVTNVGSGTNPNCSRSRHAAVGW
ncbi:hypothetical protein [Nocardia rhamnosiphila]|uniref:Uncharacterized protein n=1 Tax=Nocardia rhamnosiphila TaxID=426716 RepID=A0ABV2WLU6_9NOCA